jgi:serine protease AprX
MVMTNWSSKTNPDFDLYLYNPSGTQVASATSSTRQEYIGYTPTVTGNYKI